MRVRGLAIAGAAVLALAGSSAVAVSTSVHSGPISDVSQQLEEVEAQVDSLGLVFATATETEQDALLIEIGALQQKRSDLCGQLATDDIARDLYC